MKLKFEDSHDFVTPPDMMDIDDSDYVEVDRPDIDLEEDSDG